VSFCLIWYIFSDIHSNLFEMLPALFAPVYDPEYNMQTVVDDA
jgi:hypothetical protein